jgi:hypothetical protein
MYGNTLFRKVAMAVEMLEKNTTGDATNGKTAQSRTLVLLGLWTLEADKNPVKKSELPDKVKKMDDIFQELANEKAITLSQKGRSTIISLNKNGIQLLDEALKQNEFEFDAQIGAKSANGLLRWFRERSGSTSVQSTNGKVNSVIDSYEEFKPEALALFEKLDKGYNYGGLVPIWHMRRKLGDRVGREEFSDWMMELQAEQEFYLQTGANREATEDQKRDSITNEIRGLLFYVSKDS